MGSDLASTDTRRLLEFAAILSLNLAVFNALPLPGLDGWQLSLLAVESALRKPLPESAKESANALAGLLFLFAFSRVLLSDVADAAAGNAGLATFGIASGKALREYGPSVVIGIAAAQIVQLIRSSGDADGEATTSSRRGSGGRVATSRRKTPAKPPRRKQQTVTGKSTASQPSVRRPPRSAGAGSVANSTAEISHYVPLLSSSIFIEFICSKTPMTPFLRVCHRLLSRTSWRNTRRP